MKKILLATTLLAASSGYASADIVWAFTAAMGVAQNGTGGQNTPDPGQSDPNTSGKADNVLLAYSTAGVSVNATGASDSGLTFGAEFSLDAGTSYTMAHDDGFDLNGGGGFGEPTVWVAGTFGKLTMSDNNMDAYDTDAGQSGDYDMMYEATFGIFGLGIRADIDTGDLSAETDFTYAGFNVHLDYNDNSITQYAADGITPLKQPCDAGTVCQNLTVNGNPIWNVGVNYSFGQWTVGVSEGVYGNGADDANGNVPQQTTAKLGYDSGNGISGFVKYNSSENLANNVHINDSWDIEINYVAQGFSIIADDNTDNGEWSVYGSYDVGGGLTLEAGTNYTNDMFAGAKMTF